MTRPHDPPDTTSTATSTTSPARSARGICARCGRDHSAHRCWPEGHLCKTCVRAALKIHGVCPGCGDQRILPGRGDDGSPICPTCAGILTSRFRCHRCQVEGQLYRGKLCARCTITDRVEALLDNGTGHIDPALVPLVDALSTTTMLTPAGRLVWLRKPNNRSMLRVLATQRLPLTHPGLSAHPDQGGIPYLRALLVHCGALPKVDRQLLDYESWLARRLAGLTDHPHERLLRQFGHWHQLPRMRTKATLQPLTPPARTYAQLEFIHATAFCTWLSPNTATTPPPSPRSTSTATTPPSRSDTGNHCADS